MRKLETFFLVLLALLLLSTQIKEPKTIDWIEVNVNRITCREPVCIIAKTEIGAFFDKALYENVKKDALNRSVYDALAFLVSINDEKVRERFHDEIDLELKNIPKGDLNKNLLLANELNYRVEDDPTDNESSAKLGEILDYLRNNTSNDFLYFYVMKGIDEEYAKNLKETENMSKPFILLLRFERIEFAKFLLGFPKEVTSIIDDIENDARKETNQLRLSEDLIALSYFYLGAYPTLILKGFLFEILAAYALPLFFISLLQAITYFTLKGDDKKVLFQREHSKIVLLSSLMVLILFPLLVNLFLLFPSPPGVIYLIFILPVILPVGISLWASSKLHREYGLAKPGYEFLKTSIKESLLVAGMGAFVAIFVIAVIINIKRIFAQLSFEVVSQLMAVFILVLLSILIVMAIPHISELVAGSREIENQELKRRIESLAEKFGYSATKIRVIPSIGSSLTNASQSGFLGENVKIFISETLMDESIFTQREVEAIIAHELVHAKEKHIPKTVVGYVSISSVLILIFASVTILFESVGLNEIAGYVTFFGGYIAIILSILATLWIRRRFEYDADKKAAQMGYGADLVSALSKIYELNLMPARLSRAVNFLSSHSDLEARIKVLNEMKEDYKNIL